MNTDDRNPAFKLIVPDGDDRERSVCTRCGFVDYRNPRILVGTVATDEADRILLCQRSIEPQKGFWTLPAGFLETGETPEEGALREAEEEAYADIAIESLLAIYSVTPISQVQLIFRSRLTNGGQIRAGDETQDVMLVPYDEIPWTELAFPTVGWALRDWYAMRKHQEFAPRTNPSGSDSGT